MREILFKAKRKDKGEWVGGYYCKWKQIRRTICVTEEKIVDCIIAWMSDGSMLRHEIDSDTLCQYTGLTDKNGKKIWENDIVRNEKGDIGVVQWFEEHAAFMIWNKTKNCVCYLAENDFSKIEVNGNVFDNLELLETKE